MLWTPWQDLSLDLPLPLESLRETLEGGQAFRWARIDSEPIWQGLWADCIIRLQWEAPNLIRYSIPQSSDIQEAPIAKYLGFDRDWARLIDTLPWRSDQRLAQAIDAFPGLRLLDQPFAETLLCFLCSATKQIPQIKAMCHNLAASLGSPICGGLANALPTWERISEASEDELRALGLGFRARNIKRTADRIAQDPDCLDRIEQLPYEEAKSELMKFPGVGSKIADCSLLFGAGKLKAFPVDTWILKTLQTRYELEGWKNDQIERFGRAHFGSYAGYAQQFFFAFERSEANKG